MFCSTIIPTIGRETLSKSVTSVLEQDFAADDFEVIVINDSGKPLPDAAWHASKRVQIINTNRRERIVARNAGAAIAKGKYLHFLDDDDWLLPGAFQSLWELSKCADEAVWLYGGIRVVDGTGQTLAEVNSAMNGYSFAQFVGGAWAPIQVSLIRAKEFFAVGGFDHRLLTTQDLDLTRRVALHGDFANTPVIIACLLRGISWSTSTDYTLGTENIRFSRNAVLEQPRAFSCLRLSNPNSYWWGRITHAYMSSVIYNLRRKRLFAALSRFIYGLLAIGMSVPYMFSSDFMEALRTDHVPNTLNQALQHLERSNVPDSP